jgi:DNA ligase-associated metallophosphoesterase
MVIDVAGERVVLLADRAVSWPAGGALLVADLHWGKSSTFRAFGVPVAFDELAADLDRLRALIRSTHARCVIALGDLVHAREGLTPDVVEAVTVWRRSCPVPFVLVRGNHDRHVPDLPAAWGIEDVPERLDDGPFAFVHDPAHAPPGRYTWAGHVHPAVRIGHGPGSVRVPAWHIGPRVGVVPAFSSFAGGVAMRRAVGDRVFGAVPGGVIEVPAKVR